MCLYIYKIFGKINMKNKKNRKRDKKIIAGLRIVIYLLVLSFFGIVVLFLSLYGFEQSKNIVLQQYQQTPLENSMHFKLSWKRKLVRGEANRLFIDIEGEENFDVARVILNYDPKEMSIGLANNGDIFEGINLVDLGNGRVSISGVRGDHLKTYSADRFAEIVTTPQSDQINIGIECLRSNSSTIEVRGEKLLSCSNNWEIKRAIVYQQRQGGNNFGIGGESYNFEPVQPTGCTYPIPTKPTNVVAKPGAKRGEAVLIWSKSASVIDHYGITYGRTWNEGIGPNEYGAADVGDVSSYVIKGLETGVPYYFVVFAVNGCSGSGYSDGAASYAANPGASTTTVNNTKKTNDKNKGTVPSPMSMPDYSYYDDLDFGDDEEEVDEAVDEDFLPIPDDIEQEDINVENKEWLDKIVKILPWLGLIVLVLLGGLLVVLVKYTKQQAE
jgi:fibronectin type III domain protein